MVTKTQTEVKEGVKKVSSIERKKRIKKHIEEFGSISFPFKQYANEWGVSRGQIRKDLNIVRRNIPEKNIKEIRIDLEKRYSDLIKTVLQQIEACDNDTDRIRALDLYHKVMDRYTLMLESYGRKEKVAEKIDVQQDYTFTMIEPEKQPKKVVGCEEEK